MGTRNPGCSAACVKRAADRVFAVRCGDDVSTLVCGVDVDRSYCSAASAGGLVCTRGSAGYGQIGRIGRSIGRRCDDPIAAAECSDGRRADDRVDVGLLDGGIYSELQDDGQPLDDPVVKFRYCGDLI